MTRKEFEAIMNDYSFDEAMQELAQEHSWEITSADELKAIIKYKINNDNWNVASFLCSYLEGGDIDFYLYDPSMGILNTPVPIECEADVEHLFEEED